MSGVIPPIFASSILSVPTLISQFGNSDQSWVQWINTNLGSSTTVWYIVLYSLMIVFFTFFYTSVTFNPEEVADDMKEYGGFIPGVRAGRATAEYLNYVMNRLNTVGAIYILFVALIPTVLIKALNLNTSLPFGGTTILIIAGVGLDTLRQAKAQTEQFQYEHFLVAQDPEKIEDSTDDETDESVDSQTEASADDQATEEAETATADTDSDSTDKASADAE